MSYQEFLVPSIVTALLCLAAASIKVYEYTSAHDLGPLSIIAILTRVGIGLVYLFSPDGVVSERTVLIRLCISLMMLTEILRHALKQIRVRRARKMTAERL